jgi:hypothetical protein
MLLFMCEGYGQCRMLTCSTFINGASLGLYQQSTVVLTNGQEVSGLDSQALAKLQAKQCDQAP